MSVLEEDIQNILREFVHSASLFGRPARFISEEDIPDIVHRIKTQVESRQAQDNSRFLVSEKDALRAQELAREVLRSGNRYLVKNMTWNLEAATIRPIENSELFEWKAHWRGFAPTENVSPAGHLIPVFAERTMNVQEFIEAVGVQTDYPIFKMPEDVC